tara:strand:+ start:6667 stop:7200 length:534 start_codon:yes stop_codon:yes gene_type:complete
MFLCPKCDYSYIITKSKNLSDEKISITKVNQVFKLLNDNLSAYDFKFPIERLKKSKRFEKLSKENQKKLLENFKNKEQLEINTIFECTNCSNIEPITTTVKLFEIRKDKESSKKLENYELEYYINNPVLPRTSDYTCKNPDCITHVKKDNKEAVFFREKNLYELKYICNICSHIWSV